MGETLKIKDGVILQGLQLPMRQVLIVADKIWKKYGQELVVTAGLDGVHSAGSLHPFGYAIDLRNRYFTEAQKKEVEFELRMKLPSEYDVIRHSTHIHVEYDTKKAGIL